MQIPSRIEVSRETRRTAAGIGARVSVITIVTAHARKPPPESTADTVARARFPLSGLAIGSRQVRQ